MAPFKLYHNPRSRAVTAHAMLEEVGADYELVPVAFHDDGSRDPKVLAVNKMGKVPVLVLPEGTVVTETAAICAQLADMFPEAKLAPAPGSEARGTYYRWLFFTGSCFEPALVDTMMRKGEPVPKMAAGWGSYDDVIDTIEDALAGPDYLLGDTISAADLYLGASLGWGGLFGAPRIKESATIQSYVARVGERPSFANTMGG